MVAMADDSLDHVLREPDTGAPLVDNDGQVLEELHIDAVDEVADHGATIAELAAGARAWRFGHVIVDEAQDLTPMQWRMITRRARGGSMTLVGDLAQRSIGEPGSWRDHLPPAIEDFDYRELTINYRSPAEVNRLATSVLAELSPELTASKAIREGANPAEFVHLDHLADDLPDLIHRRRSEVVAGTFAVVGLNPSHLAELFAETTAGRDPVGKIDWLSPWQAKGLEFDTVVLVEPADFLEEPQGLSLLYVGLTRTTDRLVVAHQRPLPEILA